MALHITRETREKAYDMITSFDFMVKDSKMRGDFYLNKELVHISDKYKLWIVIFHHRTKKIRYNTKYWLVMDSNKNKEFVREYINTVINMDSPDVIDVRDIELFRHWAQKNREDIAEKFFDGNFEK